jgi:CRISPR/Cas system-associated exonuclease Cas4 (RecB family)
MTVELKAPTSHSYSRMNNYTQCPLQYKLIYVDKMGQDSSDAMEIGSAAHEFFDCWVKERYPEGSKPASFKSIETLAAECFQKESRNQSNFKEFLEICQTFAALYKPDPNYPNVETEGQFAFDRQWKRCDWFSKESMFRAKIDRIEAPELDEEHKIKKIRITDYKTGFSGAMDSFQLDVYALIASLLYPNLEQVEVQFYYVKSGFKQIKLLEVKDMDIVKVQLEALMARMEAETKWKAKPGRACQNCPVAYACKEKATGLISIVSKDTAEILGREIAVLEAQAKAKKKVLKIWCEKEGSVNASGLVYNNWPQESMTVDLAPLLSLCVEYSIDPKDILNPDSLAIKRLCKKNPSFASAVTPYIGVNVSTRFYGKKGDSEE